MLDTFKARLKAKAKAAGANLSQKRIDAIADRLHKKNPELSGDDTEHDAKIDDLYEEQDFKDFASVDDFQRARDAKDKKDKADKDKADKSGSDSDSDKGKDDDMPSWAKALLTEVQSMKAEKQQQSIAQKLSSHEKLKGIPKVFYNGRSLPQKEEDIDAFADTIVADHTAFINEAGYNGVTKGAPPRADAGGPAAGKADPAIAAYAARKAQAAQSSNK